MEKEAYLSSYYNSPGNRIKVHRVLRCLQGQTVMCFDAVREVCSLWFLAIKEP